MIEFLKFLWTGSSHKHKWKIIDSKEMINSNQATIGVRHTLQCEGCGELKLFKTY